VPRTGSLKVSPDQARTIEALEKGRDILYFAEHVLGMDLNPAQKRWLRLVGTLPNGWDWLLKVVLHVAANQIGKTLGLAVIILWGCLYKIGIPKDDPERWLNAQYVWYHLAPTQPQAYLPLRDMVLLARGDHPSQRRRCRLPAGLVTEGKIETYYDGLHFFNGAMVQFRTTDEKAKALQGRRAAAISFDECAFEAWLKAVVNEVLFMRLIASGGPLIMVSTPNGINDWFEIVQSVIDSSRPRRIAQEGDQDLGGSCHLGDLVPIWENGERWALVWSTVEDNVGFGISPEEAARMEASLDESTKEQQLRGAFLEPAEAFFVPSSKVIDAFRDLPEASMPLPGHSYVVGWDPSASTDPTAVVVLDVTDRPWRGVYFRHYSKPLGETKLLNEIFALHALYSGGGMDLRPWERRPKAITVFDETSMGGAMLRQQLARLSPKKGINLAGPSTKMNLLTNLRASINQGSLIMPKAWTQMLRELLNYRLPDDKIHQDSCMALVCAAEVAARGFSGAMSAPFRPSGRV